MDGLGRTNVMSVRTGETMTKYLSKEPFSVGGAGNAQFERNYEATFGKDKPPCPQCGSRNTFPSVLLKNVLRCRTCFAEWETDNGKVEKR